MDKHPQKTTRVSSFVDSGEDSAAEEDFADDSASAPATTALLTPRLDKQREMPASVPQKRRPMDQYSSSPKLRRPNDIGSPVSLMSGGGNSANGSRAGSAGSSSKPAKPAKPKQAARDIKVTPVSVNLTDSEDDEHDEMENEWGVAEHSEQGQTSPSDAGDAVNGNSEAPARTSDATGDLDMRNIEFPLFEMPKSASQAQETHAQASSITLAESSPNDHNDHNSSDAALQRRVQDLEHRLTNYDNLFSQLHVLQSANKIKSLEDTSHKQQAIVTELRKVVKATKKRTRTLEETARATGNSAGDLRQDLDELKTNLYHYNDDLEDLTGDLDDINDTLNRRVDDVERRLTAIEGAPASAPPAHTTIAASAPVAAHVAAPAATPPAPESPMLEDNPEIEVAKIPAHLDHDEQIRQLLKDKEDLRKDKNMYRHLYWEELKLSS